MGAFALLYLYGDEHEPLDMDHYLLYKRNSSSAGGSSSVNGAMVKVYRMAWAEHRKRRLYKGNFLHESAALFQQWLLRAFTNTEDVRPEFLEKEQTERIGKGLELQQVTLEDDDTFQVGRLYLPYNHVNSPVYWKSMLLYIQAFVFRRHLPFLFIPVTINTRSDVLKRLGLDLQNHYAFFPVEDAPRLFDRPDKTAGVYHQFANSTMKSLVENSEQYLGTRCVVAAFKL